MKLCCSCKLEKPLRDFNRNKSKSDGYNSQCRPCHQVYKQQHYDANKMDYAEKHAIRRKEIRSWFQKIRQQLSCSRCGFSHPAAIDFHHHGSDKTAYVVTMVSDAASKETILAEIAKCTPLCANCHRVLHYEEKMERAASNDLACSAWKADAHPSIPDPQLAESREHDSHALPHPSFSKRGQVPPA